MEKINKTQVIEILEQIAAIMELKNENVFKIRAFENAARVLAGHSSDLETLIKTGELETLKGIGKGHIARIIHELFSSGKCREFNILKKGIPESLLDLFNVRGLGAKKIKILYEKLGVKSVGELEYACHENRLRDLKGFGQKTQDNILKNIESRRKSAGQFLIHTAQEESERVKDYLKKQKGILEIEIAGSIRRRKEVVRDIDVLVAAKNPSAIHKALITCPYVKSVIANGETKSSVLLNSGMQCDLRTVTEEEFPAALYYFTGSKEHNVAVRTIAKKKNIKVNEYGLFKGARRFPVHSEADIFKTLGLHYVPPEMRENTGEIEWAAKSECPVLVEEKDIRGIFHVHTDESDGTAPLEKMVARAQEMGYEYIGISDHSQTAAYAHGLEPARVRKQWKEIDSLRKRFKIRIFRGIESDILPDGKLDYPDAVLAQFDFVIGSVHSKFNLPVKEMTERMRRAIDNKYITMVGHPTGRLLLTRVGYQIDLPVLLKHAKKCGVAMELNAHPHRLDLDWRVLRDVKNAGVPVVINPDAHSVNGLSVVTYGVGIARKGWLEKKDILNTMPLAQMEKFLKNRK